MSEKAHKKIGLLIGREWSWPSAFMTEVNNRSEGIVAEFIKIGGTSVQERCDYEVIIDRMSHEIPYYRTYLKYAALNGTYLINNPFMSSSDDKFFGVALANRLGIATPRTIALPNKRVENENVPESFRNLVYPMDWQGIIDYISVPAILKDTHTGGRRVAHRVHNVDELIELYDESDTLTVILQQVIESSNHIHCFVIGQKDVLISHYSLEEGRYLESGIDLDQDVRQELRRAALQVTRAYGYDINMVEFVIQDNQPYLINPANPAPDLDINLLSADYFSWCVEKAASFAMAMARQPNPQFSGYDWQRIINDQNEMEEE